MTARLRPIVPLSLAANAKTPKVVPAKIAGPVPEIRWVEPRALMVEDDYQRSLSEKSKWLIRRIVAGWSWAHVKPPIVAIIEDDDRLEKPAKGPASPARRSAPRYAVVDGQHTAIAAASHGGIEKIPVLVVDAKTVADRATAFLAHNRDRVFLTPMAIYRAALAAGDQTAKAIDAVARKAGASIVASQKLNWNVGDTISIGAIRLALRTHGPETTTAALRLLVEAKRAPLVEGEIKAAVTLLADRARPLAPKQLLAVVQSESRETWQTLAVSVAAERKQRAWQALASLWWAQATGTKPARAASPRAAPPVPPADREPAEREDVGGCVAHPAPSIVAGPPHALPPREAARPAASIAASREDAPRVRNARVEEAVLRAIDRGPADFETIRTRAEFPANNVRLALEALAAEKTIRAKGGIWQRQGDQK